MESMRASKAFLLTPIPDFVRSCCIVRIPSMNSFDSVIVRNDRHVFNILVFEGIRASPEICVDSRQVARLYVRGSIGRQADAILGLIDVNDLGTVPRATDEGADHVVSLRATPAPG